MNSSETFGIQNGYGKKITDWLNDQAQSNKIEFEAKLYDCNVKTQNFGTFEMFSWMGDVPSARKLLIKASKRFKIKTLEGGYKPKERTFRIKKHDYAIVRHGNKIIGQLEFVTSRLRGNSWELKSETRQ